MERMALAGNPSRTRKLRTETCVSGYAKSRYAKLVSADRAEDDLIQRFKQRYSNMLWNVWSITSHGIPLHPDLTPDVLTCILPLGTVRSGKESKVESVHHFLTIIQFFSARRLTSQTQALAYTTLSLHIHLHMTKVMW